ncbi:MAG TPA: mismatch-specific DNA-glycosylase [Acidimicrobiia bacterium]|nr:mismatch-specific DNA-glycosylase [Acidimicrobiia bacterium]
MGFTREQLEAFKGTTLPDLLGPDIRLLFVGINPGLWTAATQTHFCHPSNRFYPALRRAGLIDLDIDTDVGMTDAQRAEFLARGMGVTNLVSRASARASEITAGELRDGGDRLLATIATLRPAVVAIAGVTAYRTAFGQPNASLGRQEPDVSASQIWAVPNPSGLNAHETIDSLARWLGDVGTVAGLL